MSQENHPNLHAVGLQCDIIDAIQDRMRGSSKARMVTQLLPQITAFVESIELKIDELVERESNDNN